MKVCRIDSKKKLTCDKSKVSLKNPPFIMEDPSLLLTNDPLESVPKSTTVSLQKF